MSQPLHVRSRSYADDAVYRAALDVAQACAHLEWRLVGGIAVHLQQRRHRLDDLPDRATQDADVAIQIAAGPGREPDQVAADVDQLLDSLAATGYRQQGRSNRFVRPHHATGPDAVIDVLVPGYRTSIRHNRAVAQGRMLVDEVPGLGLALGSGQPADVVDLTVELLEGHTGAATIPLASVFALLVVKAGAWRGRRSAKDALDVWRLLEMAREQGLQPHAWPGGGSAGHARDVLIRDATAIAQAATATTRSQARIRALIAAHVGADDG